MSHFSTHCKIEGVRHPAEIDRTTILRFQIYLSEILTANRSKPHPFKLSSRLQLLGYIRTWIRWMLRVGYLHEDPWVHIKLHRQVPKVPRPLEEDEIAQLFETHRTQAFSLAPFYYHRREVVLVLLYGWGLRVHELQAINVTSMDARLDFVTVINKGGSTKAMPYGDSMKKVVLRYLTHRSKHAVVGEDALLIDRQGKRLSLDMIYQIVVELGRRAHVTINPHRLRDTFGTTMLDQDVPVERLMKMMGHTNRKTTLSYARVGDETVKREHDRVINPLIDQLIGDADWKGTS
jgi:integrase/recombinase XerC